MKNPMLLFFFENERVTTKSARILPIGLDVKEGDKRGKSTSFDILVSGRPRSREFIKGRFFSG